MRRLVWVLSAALLIGVLPIGAGAGTLHRSVSSSLIDDAEDCLEPVPASYETDYLTGGKTVKLEVDVLLDGMAISEGEDVMASAATAYAPLKIEMVPRFTVVEFDASGEADGHPYATSASLFAQMKQHFRGRRPADSDVVYLLTAKDIQGGGATGGYTAGIADCIGGVRYDGRAFAMGQFDGTRGTYSSKIAAHEIGHLMGAHHHYTNCVEGIPAGVEENANGDISGAICTTMAPDLFFVSLTFGTLESAVIRGHALDYADRAPPVPADPSASPKPTGTSSPAPSSSSSSAPQPQQSTASSTPTPREQQSRVEHARFMTLSLRRHLVARGRTESPGSPASCVSDVQVHVLRWSRVRGEWVRVATTTTGVEGAFRVRLADRPGRYVAMVEAANVDPGNGCEAARSNAVRHRHS